jgi:hypothetical protein
LGGSGTITPAAAASFTVNSGGVLAPGSAAGTVGTLTFDGGTRTGTVVSMLSGSSVSFDLGAGNASDAIRFLNFTSGDLSVAGTVTLNFANTQAGTYELFQFYTDGAGSVTATSGVISSGFTLGSGLSGFTSALNYNAGSISLTVSAIPEPSSYAALLGAGILGYAVCRRRSRKTR